MAELKRLPPQSQQTRKRWLKPLQVVEHVNVHEGQLNEFRNIMMHRNGPAMNFVLSERKWCHSFYALETEEVWLHSILFFGFDHDIHNRVQLQFQ